MSSKILKTMLAADLEKRYQSTDELAHDLEYFIYGTGYGPTVVTLEKYMRNVIPSLYAVNSNSAPIPAVATSLRKLQPKSAHVTEPPDRQYLLPTADSIHN